MSDQGEIRGLTTAAGIWLAAAIGLAVGIGREMTVVVSTAIAWVILTLLPRFEALVTKRRKSQEIFTVQRRLSGSS